MSKYCAKIRDTNINVITNKFAKQADSSIMYSENDCTLLVTVVEGNENNEVDFFPLTVNFLEKLSAVGKIPGNYPRREGKSSDYATLCARIIDRPIRPMFPKNYNTELQITCSLYDLTNNDYPDITGINATSLCLMMASKIPFEEFVCAVNVSLINDEFFINAPEDSKINSILELKLAGTFQEITMVEAECSEVAEEKFVDAILFGHTAIKELITFHRSILDNETINKDSYENSEENNPLIEEIILKLEKEFTDAICTSSKNKRKEKYKFLKLKLEELYPDLDDSNKLFSIVEKHFFRKITLSGNRVDFRKPTDIRELSSEVNLFKTVHGSALFTRGETQVVSSITLGVKNDAQILDGIEKISDKYFFLHYNFPSFSVGEVRRMGPPNRREIGHGTLAEKAISKVMPNHYEFPYTVRVVADVLESNGSSSQATICATSLALMQAGVPIKKHVAGIAMGLVKEDKEFVLLTDIQGLEDHYGDMDFKVAGTVDGICAVQMDMKISGVSRELLTKALEQAKNARMEILENMENCIKFPNENLSPFAPKVITFCINKEKIRSVIGKGGETINKIIEDTGVKIDISEEGDITIYGKDVTKLKEAENTIKKLTKVYSVGEIYSARVERIEKFGAFVKFDKFDKDALLHISKLSVDRVENVESILSLGDAIQVEIIDVDLKGKIKVKLGSEI